jgi:ABC-type oligopeptide transport system substrate-binding subunit
MHRRLALVVLPALCALVGSAAATATHQRTTSSLSAAPFAQSWAQVPQTQSARRAKDVLVFGMEQDIDGFNTILTCCNSYWAAVTGNVPELRGAYNITNNLKHVLDLVSSAKATRTGLSYTIRPDAYWYWGGKKLPVTYKDFVYTWQQIVNPKNDVVGRDGYDQITGFTHSGQKQITFRWKQPYAD